jgi:hypothetical protein
MLGERRLREGLARLADRDDGAVGFALVVEIAGSYLSPGRSSPRMLT